MKSLFRSSPEKPIVSDTLARIARLVLFLVDTSTSVGERATNDTVPKYERFYTGLTIARNVFAAHPQFSKIGEVGCVLFNTEVTLCPFTAAASWVPPRLVPTGATHTGKALLAAMEHLSKRLAELNTQGPNVDRPYIVLVSDGEPYGEPQSVVAASYAKAREFEAQGYAEFLLMGVEESDRQHLLEMGLRHPPLIVQDTNWETIFRWVSQRVSTPALGQRAVSLSLPKINP